MPSSSAFEMFWVAALKKGGIFQNYTPQKATLKSNSLVGLTSSKTKTAQGLSLLVFKFQPALQRW